ncbi:MULTISPECIES: DUF742 domain-containing protein [Micromonospora]|uniref:DUF742 domain-containing protein n=1 Tax=Micromonospora marina TaxID=307120 RepID=A0A1C4YXT5_9ACTN|nr:MULTISPECIES: DUF742 domain-containing protein [Micromonospora]MBF5032105.1 DUF742 domain-containing protein [Micromonospora sp. ANENR4]MCZ7477914.1 DUF742 domain-containing protein [Micromonospora sp. WMMC273]MDW3850536.1 DUF742 domain-containing protein [Micromonospora sp. BRA006-A]WBC02623.1 DUF742 domain-containing protein [Micromonospora sp. WMMA1976]SCF25494.1 Protein of unknown function [Micromonospora marina]
MIPGAAGADPEPEPGVRIRPFLNASAPVPEPDAGDGEPTGPRPFVLTSGRVDGDPAIGLETQVTARPGSTSWAVTARLAPELAAIVAICAEPVSVAEISARTRMHFGVTRVLVGDLRAAGHLDVHVADVDDALDPDIILRVIDGLRAIS